jgi:hypothetical protein
LGNNNLLQFQQALSGMMRIVWQQHCPPWMTCCRQRLLPPKQLIVLPKRLPPRDFLFVSALGLPFFLANMFLFLFDRMGEMLASNKNINRHSHVDIAVTAAIDIIATQFVVERSVSLVQYSKTCTHIGWMLC